MGTPPASVQWRLGDEKLSSFLASPVNLLQPVLLKDKQKNSPDATPAFEDESNMPRRYVSTICVLCG